MKFCWVTIHVEDIGKSVAFYQEILELKLQQHMKPNPEMEIVFLGAGQTQVELIWHKGKRAAPFSQDISLGFVTPSLDQTMRMLREKQIPIVEGPVQPSPDIRFAFIQDPDGLKIQLVEHLTSV